MEHSGGYPRSRFLLLVILTQLAVSSSVYPPAPSPSEHPPSSYPPASAPASLPMVWNLSPSPLPEALAPSLPPPSTVAPSPGEVHNHGSVPSSREPGKGGGGDGHSGGMSGGQKAGITVAVVVVAAAAVAVGFVYKKRRENVRRGEYSYAVRRDIL